MEFISSARPGRALDLGCGTGTNAVTLSQRGWQVTGIDIAPKAIRIARRKARRAGLKIDFLVGDVSDLSGIKGPFDYALDIGCLFGLHPKERTGYEAGLSRLIRKGGCYMLYAWLPREWRGKRWGMTQEAVYDLFTPSFKHLKTVIGEEKGAGSAWYWFKKQ
jgi:SAM-dependent methyltransferase